MNLITDVKNYFSSRRLENSLLLKLSCRRDFKEVELIIEPSEFFWSNVPSKDNDGIYYRHFRQFLFQGVNEVAFSDMRFPNNGVEIYQASHENKSTFTINDFKLEVKELTKMALPIESFGNIYFNFECLWVEERIAKVIMNNNEWIYLDKNTNKEFDFYNPFLD